MTSSLALLSLRRTLHPGLLGALAILVLLLAGADRTPSWLAATGLDAGRVARGLARQGVWTGGLLLLAPALLLHAGRTIDRWRRADREWLAPRALGSGAALASTLAGQLVGAAVLLSLLALAAELAAGGSAPTRRATARLAVEDPLPAADGAGIRWRWPDPGARAPEGSVVRARLDVRAGVGPGADVLFSARRVRDGAPGEERRVERRVARAGLLELPLPPGPGELELELARRGPGASLALTEPWLELFVPAGGERRGSLELSLRAWLALAAWSALALGLGAWVSAPTAALAAGTLAIGPALAGAGSPAGWPGVGLARAIGWLGEGLLAPVPGSAPWIGTLACLGLGWALARLGMRAGGGGA